MKHGHRITFVCPECLSGKHANCDGDAWDFINDVRVECECGEHNHNPMDRG